MLHKKHTEVGREATSVDEFRETAQPDTSSQTAVAAAGDHAFQHITTTKLHHDVTGGIRLKLQCGQNIVFQSKGQTNVVICGLMSDVLKNVTQDLITLRKCTRIVYQT